jgi:hypothetical protein
MNFSTGRNTDQNSVLIRYDGSFTRTGTIEVFESGLSMGQTSISFVSQFINPVRFTKQLLPESIQNGTYANAYTGLIPMQRYTVFCNSVYDIKIINAKYGNLYAGGIEFVLADIVASSNDDYAYEVPMYVYDLPVLFQYTNLGYKITQNLSFDIADYTDSRRIFFTTIQTDNQFGKLSLIPVLVGNELQISCKDTKGQSAGVHIANDIGLSNTTLQCTALIAITGINADGETIYRHVFNIANEDYSDNPITCYLPNLNKNIVACEIAITYNIAMYTLSNNITLYTRLILTDQQISKLRHALVSDIDVALYAMFDENNIDINHYGDGVDVGVLSNTDWNIN